MKIRVQENSILLARGRKTLIALGFFLILIVLVYSSSFLGEPIYQDHRYLQLSREYLEPAAGAAPSLPDAAVKLWQRGRPLTDLSFLLNFQLGGEAFWSYHLFNLLLHLANFVLLAGLFFLLYRSTEQPENPGLAIRAELKHPLLLTAMAMAGIWAVHPAQTMAVSYVAERRILWAAFFLWGSLNLYIYGRIKGNRRLPVAAWAIAGLGLTAHPGLIFFPLLIGLYELTRPGLGRRLKTLPGLLSLAAVLFMGGVALLSPLGLGGLNAITGPAPEPLARLLTGARAAVHYVTIWFWPTPGRFRFFYSFPLSQGFFAPPTSIPSLVGFLLLAGAAGYAWYSARKVTLFSLGIFWFLFFISPSFFLPRETVYDYRLYLSAPGLVLALFAGGESLGKKRRLVPLLRIAGLIIIVGLALISWQRNKVYLNETAFWRDNLAKTPGDRRVYFNLGDALQRSGKLIEAEQILRMALQKTTGPELTTPTLVKIAQIEMRGQRFAAAEQTLKQSLKIHPDDYNALILLGLALEKQGRIAEAEDRWLQALTTNPQASTAYLHLARLAALKKNMAAAKGYLEENLKLQPGSEAAHLMLGQLYQREGLWEKAKEEYLKVLMPNPRQPQAHFGLGMVFQAQNLLFLAQQEFLRILETDPRSGMAHLQLAYVYYRLGLPKEAIFYYQQALKFLPPDPQLYFNLGNAYLVSKNPLEAEQAFFKAVKMKPDLAEAWNNLGKLKADQNNFTEADRMFRQALTLAPRNKETLMNLGLSLARQGKSQEARDYIRQALAIDPKYYPAYYNLALMDLEAKDFPAARRNFEQVLKLFPDFKAAKEILADWNYIQSPDFQTRREALLKELREPKTSPPAPPAVEPAFKLPSSP